MIVIHPTEIVICIETSQPASDYVETLNDLVTILQNRTNNEPENAYYAFELLRAMLPTAEQAQLIFRSQLKPNPTD